MKQVFLGRSGVAVSDICLGTMTFGRATPAQDAFRQMDLAVDAGITFFDCAEMYPVPARADTLGRSEQVIGEWLSQSGKRDQVQIATKVSGPGRQELRSGEGFSGSIIKKTVEASLVRLGVDMIDLYQLHWPMRGGYAFRQNWKFDPSQFDPVAVARHMEEVLDALGELIAEGKIRSFGLSNETAWGTMRWLGAAEKTDGPRVASVQNEYSLLDRLYDTDMAELSCAEEVPLLAYSPLAAGLLTGKYADGAIPQGSRAWVVREMGEAPTLGGRLNPHVHEAVAAYRALAQANDLDTIHMAIAFTRQRPFPVIPIIGATTVDQLRHILAGLDLRLDQQQRHALDEVHRTHPMPY